MTAEARLNPRAVAAGTVCAYCGLKRLDGWQPPEHPIPLVLDSRITTYTTCEVCQPLVSSSFESAWLRDVFVQAERAKAPVANSRTRRTRRSKETSTGSGPDGRPKPTRGLDLALTKLMTGPDGHDVVLRNGGIYYPGSIRWRPDGSAHIMATDPDRRDALVAEANAVIEARTGAPARTQDPVKFSPTFDDLEVAGDVTPTMVLGCRMGAKMALAFAAEAFSEEWRSTPHAAQLREWMWSEQPLGANGQPIGWTPENPDRIEALLTDPPNHLVFFAPQGSRDDIHVVVLLFGRLGWKIPVAPRALGRPSLAWRSGPSYGASVVTTWDEILMTAAKRSPHWKSSDDDPHLPTA